MSAPVDELNKACAPCKRQFAKYTCPTCNAPYCSLTCFRSQAHSSCSESFYKHEVQINIATQPSKSAEERLKMLDLLKRFEEENQQSDILHEPDSDGDDDDLSKRFREVDLDSTSPDALWSLLTDDERARFMKVFDDPTSDAAQRLLGSAQLEREILPPWWELQSVPGETQPSQHATPPMMRVPANLIKPRPQGPSLIYNLCAICIAYAHTIRHLGISSLSSLVHSSPDRQGARKNITRLVPFLTERTSTFLPPSMTALITDLWARFEAGVMTGKQFAVFLRDTVRFLRPRQVIPLPGEHSCEDELSSQPNSAAILVLSDLNALFSNRTDSSKPKINHVTQKLVFYAAHVLSTPGFVMQMVADEAERRAVGYMEEECQKQSDEPVLNDRRGLGRVLVQEI